MSAPGGLYEADNLTHDLPRRFTGVHLDACYWWLHGLSLRAKVVLAEIYALSPEGSRGCYAGNKRFGRLLDGHETGRDGTPKEGVHDRTVERILDELLGFGLISREYEEIPGGRRRWLKLTAETPEQTIRQALLRRCPATPEDAGQICQEALGQICHSPDDKFVTTSCPEPMTGLSINDGRSLESESTCLEKQQQAEVHEGPKAALLAVDQEEPCLVLDGPKAAAAACLNIEEGDGTQRDGEGASPLKVAEDFYRRVVSGEPMPAYKVAGALFALGMQPEVAEFLLATYDHAAIAYWIAKCGGKTSPSGFIRAQLQKNAPRPALVAESGKKGGQAGSAPDREDWKEERQRVQVADYEQTQAYLRDLRENGTKEWKPEEGSGFARMKEAMKGDRSTRAVMDQIEAQAAALKLGEGR